MTDRVRYIIDNGWLRDVRVRASPNHDARPAGVAVDALIVHGITLPPGQFGHGQVDRLFTNTLDIDKHASYADLDGLRVSAHLLIERHGRLTQYVSCDDRAWHAGASRLQARERVNDFAVGIELEGTDDCPYAPAQYKVLADVAAALMRHYPSMTRQRIVGHNDIAPGRKTDPGPAFDWSFFAHRLEAACT